MEIRRIGPDGSAADWLRTLENRVRSLETSPAGAIVIRETLTTTDPATGVSTVIGVLPDGSNGLQQFINDTTPPEKPSNPSASVNLGTIAITWDGLDYLGGNPPADYDKTIVESSDSEIGPWVFEQEFRGAGTALVVGLPLSVERFFRLISLDKNGNASEPSSTVGATPVPLVESPDIAEAIAAVEEQAQDAQATADGKNTIYFQTAMPTGGTYKVGDSWIDTNDGNKLYTYNGTTFVNAQDAGIGTALTTAQGKNKVYYQATMPGTGQAGDTWFDTDDGNKIYVHNGTTYVSARDAAIATTEATANTALTTANGKNKVYYQTTMPGSGQLGDTWFDTDDGNKIYVHNGTTFVNAQDTAIATAQTTANTKGTIYAQATAPAPDPNGLWIDTSAGNMPLKLTTKKAIYRTSSGGSAGSRFTTLGWDVTTAATDPTLAEVMNYDVLIIDYGFSLPGTGLRTLAADAYAAGVSVFTSGNDTSVFTPLFTGSASRGTPKNPIRASTLHPVGTGWADYADNDLNLYLTGVNASAIVTGVSLITSLGTDQPINVIMEDPTTRARWAHVQTYATPSAVLDAHIQWLAARWRPVRDQVAVQALTSANGKNRVYYQTTMPSGGTYILGDTWFDTDDGNKIYVHNGTTFVNAQDALIVTANSTANTALTSANGKNRVYYQTAMPTGGTYILGDTWFDTDDGNKIYVHNGTTFVAAQDAAIAAAATAASNAQGTANTALTSANGKNRVYYQTSMPTGGTYILGDTWFDTDDGNKIYVHNGTTFVASQDAAIAAAASAASGAQTTANTALTSANGKNKNYYQTAMPTGGTYIVGDLWFDTDDSNKVYAWNGSIWASARDGGITTAANAAATAQQAANDALTAAQAAQAVADGSIRTWYQSTAPTGLNATTDIGDLWFDTDDGQAYRWNGTAWVIIEDNSIAAALAAAQNAQSTADGKITSYYQPGQPATGEIGDLWFDTDDKNKPYYCSSISPLTWTVVRDGTIADAQTTANTALTSANGKNKVYYQTSMPTGGTYILGDTWFDTDDGNKIYVHNGTTFVNAQDTAIASAATAASNAQGTANTALTSANGKNKTYYGTTMPSGGTYILGDTWFDTDDGNKLYVHNGTTFVSAQDAAIATAQTAATNAQTTANTALTSANGKNRVYYQTSMPTGGTYILGDTWFDTDDGNKIYVHNGTTFVSAQDAAIATAQTAANNAQTSANGKNKNYYQTTQPSGGTYIAGDLWFDTDDNYKLYTYTGSAWQVTQDAAGALSTANSKTKTYFQTASPGTVGNTAGDIWFDTDDGNRPYVWNGTAWTDARDTTISAAQSTANTALTSANGKNRVYYQTSMPTGGTYILGDTWFDTDDGNKIYVHNGTTFVASQDAAIAAAQTTANAKTKTYFQTASPGTVGNTLGDIWFDTDDGNKPYVWNGSSWANAQDATIAAAQTTANTAVTSANGKNKVYYQTAMPTGGTYILGDTWFDTDDGNKIYVHNGTTFVNAQDATIATAQTAANNAQTTANTANTTANSKTKTFIQGTSPTATAVGDIWIDTANGNVLKTWEGSSWVTRADAAIAAAQTAANTAQTSANGKNTVFYQGTSPVTTGRVTGDTWFDTANGYRVSVWNGSAWTLSQDATIATAQTTANTANTTANSKTKTFIQGTSPTATAVGDIWIDTANGNVLKTWEGSSWVTRADAAIAAAQTTANTAVTSANGKNKVYYQTAMPTGGTYILGDTWFDTDDGNKIYVHNGTTFTSSPLGTNAIANLAITNAQIADATIQSAKIGSVDAGTITVGTLSAARIGADTITSTHIASDAITSNELAAGSITAAKGQISNLAVGTAQIQDTAITTAKIANLAVTNAQIADATIQSAKIGSVDAGTITVGTLSAARIGADTITSTHIASDAITSNELAAGSITAAKGQISNLAVGTAQIQDTAITTAKIANLAVTNAQIADATIASAKISALDAGKITTGTLDAQRIAAGTITTDKLSVGDFTNVLDDPDFNTGTGWQISGQASLAAISVGVEGAPTNALRITANATTVDVMNKNVVSVLGGDKYYGSIYVKSDGAQTNGTIHFATTVKLADNTLQYPAFQQVTATSIGTSWTKLSGTITIPTNAVSMQARVSVRNDTTGGVFWWDHAIVRRMTNATLIEAGTLTTASGVFGDINASSITSGYLAAARIQADSITGSMIAAGTITAADAVFANAAITSAAIASLDAAKITTGTLDANRIGADTITGAHILGGSITAADAVFANAAITSANIASLDAAKITTGYLDAARIQADSITGSMIAAGTITAADAVFANAAITSAAIASLDAAKITTGTLDANRIAAGTITTAKLSVGDFTDLVDNGTFETDFSNWVVNGATITTTAPYMGTKSAYFTSGNNIVQERQIAVSPGENLLVTVWYKTSADKAGGGGIRLMDQLGAEAATYNVSQDFGVSTSYIKLSVVATIKAGVTTIRPRLAFALSAGNVTVDNFSVRRMVGAVLIENGAISAGSAIIGTAAITSAMISQLDAAKITTGTLDANRIGADTITGAHILGGSITAADAVFANAAITSAAIASLDAGKITTGTLDANRIAADTITGAHIAGGSITAADAVFATAAITSAAIASLDAGKITTGTLDAARIAADTITGAHILGGSITAADAVFANAAITSAAIASLDAAKITTGYLDAARIQADTITGAHILGGSITAADAVFANAAITSAAIASLDAGKITTGTLDANRIAANTISASKLMVGSNENVIANADFSNPDSTPSGASWQTATGISFNATGGRGSTPSMRITGLATGVTTLNLENRISVSPGTWFAGSISVKSTFALTAGKVSLTVRCYTTASASTDVVVATNSLLVANTWTEVKGKVQVPTDTIAVEFFLTIINNATGTITDIDYVSATRALTGELVVDGLISAGSAIIGTAAITSAMIAQLDAAKITTGTLDANRIGADTITGAHIQGGSITAADAVFANAAIQSAAIASLDAGKITTGTLDANRIAADTITGAHILGGSVTAADGIFANAAIVNANIASLDAAKITTGYLDANRIQADTITGAHIAGGSISAADAVFANAAITSANIASLDAVKITTGVLDANRIGAKTITANHLLIGDLTNLWENSDFEGDTVGQQPKGIVANANVSVIDSSGFVGTAGNGSARMMSINALNGSDNTVLGTELHKVELDDELYMSYEGRHLNTTGTGVTWSGFYLYGPTKAYLTTALVTSFSSGKVTVMTPKSGTYKATAGVSYVQPFFRFNNNAETTNRFYVDNVIVRRKNTGNLIVDGAITTSKIYAGAVTATELATNAVTAIKINAGAITADKLESNLILATTIIAGDPDGTYAQMNQEGFRVFADNAVDGAPSQEVVRLGVAATNDFFAITKADGSVAATISDGGVGSFNKLAVPAYDGTITEEKDRMGFWYGGDEFQTHLNQGRLIARAYRNTFSAFNAASGVNQPYCRLDRVQLKAGNLYRISTGPVRMDHDAGTNGYMTIWWKSSTTDPTVAATIGGTSVAIAETVSDAGPVRTSDASMALVSPTSDCWASFLFAFSSQGPGQVGIRSSSAAPFRMLVENLGKDVGTSGIYMDGTNPPPPAVNTYQKQYGSAAIRSYDGANNTYNFDTGHMYQGLSPAGYGNLKSISIANNMTADLSGATINWMRVYFLFDHWYYNSGGTARVGVHGWTSLPSSFNGTGSATFSAGGIPKPGDRWIDIPSSYWSQFASGTLRGVFLEGDSTYGTYGYARPPVIEVNYTK